MYNKMHAATIHVLAYFLHNRPTSTISPPSILPQCLTEEVWDILGGPINEVLVYKLTPTFVNDQIRWAY